MLSCKNVLLDVQKSYLLLALSFNSMGFFFPGVGPLWFFIGCFACNTQNLFPLLVHIGGSVWIWMKSNLFLLVEAKINLALLGKLKWVWPLTNRYRIFFATHPHSLQVCTKLYCTWMVLQPIQPTLDQMSCWVRGQLYCPSLWIFVD